MNNKRGLSLIVLVVFSLVIVSVIVTIGLRISKIGSRATFEEQNYLSDVSNESNQTEKTYMNFSVWYERVGNKGIIKVNDELGSNVMYTCLKVENGVTPNVGVAQWSYDLQFEITEPGEYMIYGKDVNGNISDSVIIIVEI